MFVFFYYRKWKKKENTLVIVLLLQLPVPPALCALLLNICHLNVRLSLASLQPSFFLTQPDCPAMGSWTTHYSSHGSHLSDGKYTLFKQKCIIKKSHISPKVLSKCYHLNAVIKDYWRLSWTLIYCVFIVNYSTTAKYSTGALPGTKELIPPACRE